MPGPSVETIETRTLAPLQRRIGGSFFAPFLAWTLVHLGLIIFGVANTIEGALWLAGISSVFILAVWLLFLLPLYLLVPRHSSLWRPFECTLYGSLTGAVITLVLWNFVPVQGLGHDQVGYFLATTAAILGGLTCLIGSLTRYYFHYVRRT